MISMFVRGGILILGRCHGSFIHGLWLVGVYFYTYLTYAITLFPHGTQYAISSFQDLKIHYMVSISVYNILVTVHQKLI